MKKAIKKKKTAVRSYKRRKKMGTSDALRAFMLVGLIVALSAAISFAVIMVHATVNGENNSEEISVTKGDEPAQTPKAEPVEEVVSVPQPPARATSEESRPSSQTPTVREPPKPERNVPVQPQRNTSAQPTTSGVTASSSVTPSRVVENQGTLVFVIDDAGNNLRELEPFLRIPGPLTIAVLPGLPHSAEAARLIRASGKEVILHQPMEAIGGQNPGPGAIYSNMSAQEIRAVLSRNVAEIGPIAGMNNHQGSKITMDREAMQTILAFCAENNLYFLDSRTTADTVVPAVARQMGMRIAERNVFIDNEQNKASMLRYITGGLTRAQRNGSAVMIGHTWSPELAGLLTEQFPLFIEQGYNIKTASDIIK
ncbi:MAG: divergent polysaccharide deacetylase family protein [Treponema sp.]|jgi:polysaccharide deacetylase 2 family uncharacterized protein YibQ|nr:divergent polysaccharide deacetylase family protein [Treponema sp.]